MPPASPSQRPRDLARCAGAQSASGPPGVAVRQGLARCAAPRPCSRPRVTGYGRGNRSPEGRRSRDAGTPRPPSRSPALGGPAPGTGGPSRRRGARGLRETVAWKLGRAGGATELRRAGPSSAGWRAAARGAARLRPSVQRLHSRVGGGPGPRPGLRCRVPPARGRPSTPPSTRAPAGARPVPLLSRGGVTEAPPATHRCTARPSRVCACVWRILTAVAAERSWEPARAEPTSPPRPAEAYVWGRERSEH